MVGRRRQNVTPADAQALAPRNVGGFRSNTGTVRSFQSLASKFGPSLSDDGQSSLGSLDA